MPKQRKTKKRQERQLQGDLRTSDRAQSNWRKRDDQGRFLRGDDCEDKDELDDESDDEDDDDDDEAIADGGEGEGDESEDESDVEDQEDEEDWEDDKEDDEGDDKGVGVEAYNGGQLVNNPHDFFAETQHGDGIASVHPGEAATPIFRKTRSSKAGKNVLGDQRITVLDEHGNLSRQLIKPWEQSRQELEAGKPIAAALAMRVRPDAPHLESYAFPLPEVLPYQVHQYCA